MARLGIQLLTRQQPPTRRTALGVARALLMEPLHAIEAAVSDILAASETIEAEIPELDSAEDWRTALGLLHGAQGRLRDQLRTMLNYARDQHRT